MTLSQNVMLSFAMCLKRREAHFRHQIELLKASAMEKLNSGNKKGAVMDLKRSKTYEKQVDMILSVTGTMQTQVDNWESSITNAANFKAMALSTDAMKKSAVIVGQEQVDQMMDDTKDLNVAINETNLAFAQDIDVDVMDDDDLLAELHDMKPAKPAAPTLPAPTLPAVPNRPLPAWEEDFKKLEAELAA
mmetsp:Transcript_34366/g.79334  ORF Transcript_34366/g.79334 Transcript_34366/m.79334 type:complete len:190 (+) Transcript_34366:88-657(+)